MTNFDTKSVPTYQPTYSLHRLTHKLDLQPYLVLVQNDSSLSRVARHGAELQRQGQGQSWYTRY